MAKEPPTHRLAAVCNADGRWYEMGVGWYDASRNRFTFKFSPYVDVSRLEPEDRLMAFPLDEGRQPSRQDLTPRRPTPKPSSRSPTPSSLRKPDDDDDDLGPFGDDDIPF